MYSKNLLNKKKINFSIKQLSIELMKHGNKKKIQQLFRKEFSQNIYNNSNIIDNINLLTIKTQNPLRVTSKIKNKKTLYNFNYIKNIKRKKQNILYLKNIVKGQPNICKKLLHEIKDINNIQNIYMLKYKDLLKKDIFLWKRFINIEKKNSVSFKNEPNISSNLKCSVMNKTVKLEIKVQSFSNSKITLLFKSIRNILNLNTNFQILCFQRLPLKKRNFVVLRSPHVNKKSKDQFIHLIYQGLVKIEFLQTPKTLNILKNLSIYLESTVPGINLTFKFIK